MKCFCIQTIKMVIFLFFRELQYSIKIVIQKITSYFQNPMLYTDVSRIKMGRTRPKTAGNRELNQRRNYSRRTAVSCFTLYAGANARQLYTDWLRNVPRNDAQVFQQTNTRLSKSSICTYLFVQTDVCTSVEVFTYTQTPHLRARTHVQYTRKLIVRTFCTML